MVMPTIEYNVIRERRGFAHDLANKNSELSIAATPCHQNGARAFKVL